MSTRHRTLAKFEIHTLPFGHVPNTILVRPSNASCLLRRVAYRTCRCHIPPSGW
ncbi:hypothetical protein BN903_53 [Halorubrum sp. AJ67]|nr:hypothetical protein BN903_53 [Halorubrum sp. AJ67]